MQKKKENIAKELILLLIDKIKHQDKKIKQLNEEIENTKKWIMVLENETCTNCDLREKQKQEQETHNREIEQNKTKGGLGIYGFQTY